MIHDARISDGTSGGRFQVVVVEDPGSAGGFSQAQSTLRIIYIM
jgi:hypothetical protein